MSIGLYNLYLMCVCFYSRIKSSLLGTMNVRLKIILFADAGGPFLKKKEKKGKDVILSAALTETQVVSGVWIMTSVIWAKSEKSL